MVLSKMSMKFFSSIGALALGAVFCVAPALSAQTSHVTTLAQPTPAQRQALKKILAGQAPQSKSAVKETALLPAKFDGWVRGPVLVSHPEAANAAALTEFGLERIAQANYSLDGNRVAVRVLKFPDATGAYGSFTMLRLPGMKAMRIGSSGAESFNGAYAGNSFLFWQGNLLVDATFAQPVTSAAAVLADLGDALPLIAGPRSVAPGLPAQLPRKGLDAGSVQYALGAASYQREGGVVPVAVMDFDIDAEVVTAHYGAGTLTIISYPTPEIAQAREAAIGSVLQSGIVPGTKDAEFVKRSGPLVALTSGDFTAAEAKALLAQVQFQGRVAIEQLKPQKSEAEKTAEMLVSVALITIILGGASILLGFFLGGGRALYRVMRGKPASSVTDEEFIVLELSKPVPARHKDGGTAGGK